MSLETEVEILKKEISDIKQIHFRLDTAIIKISDVSNSINRMLAVHEEKLSRQEESQEDLNRTIEARRNDFSEQIQLLHKIIESVDLWESYDCPPISSLDDPILVKRLFLVS